MEANELSNFDLRHEAQKENPSEEVLREAARRGIHIWAQTIEEDK